MWSLESIVTELKMLVNKKATLWGKIRVNHHLQPLPT